MKNYYDFSVEEMMNTAKMPVEIRENNEAIFKYMAREMANLIQENNQKSEKTVVICPVGPVGQYPYFVEIVNEEKIDLKDTWFINMDEYLVAEDEWINKDHALSFRGFMQRNVYEAIDNSLVMPENQRIFPNPKDTTEIPRVIKELGKVDLTVGGIGINGHVAFNEPDGSLSNEDFLKLETRILDIAPETRTANTIGDLQGALEEMPHRCVTIGINEINQANRIILGCFREWHKGVVRRTVCGEPTSEFPVTLLQKHPNIQLLITDFVAKMGE